MFRILRTWLALLGMGLLLAACGGSDGDGGNVGTRIYMIAAPTGQLLPGDSPQSWTLVLDRPAQKAFWYEDRPGRSSGEQDLNDYVRSTWGAAYGDIEPHATLHFEESGVPGLNVIYARLSQPVYDDKTGQLRVPMHLLADSEPLANAVMVTANTLMLEVMNNAVDDKEVASYLQYAEQAAFQPTSAAGHYQLVMQGALDSTLMVDNAPGQYYDIRSTRDFSNQWNAFFAGNPPNVAVHGYDAAGGMRLYFVTLSNPRYDQAAGMLTYDAVTLGGDTSDPLALTQVTLNIDSGVFSRFPTFGKGTAYQGFGQGYDPSRANDTQIYFGSDIARKQFGSLWGTQSYLQASCAGYCRNDLQKMKDMGINLVRVYDWDTRNDHKPFLDYAQSLGIKVIVPVSNYLPCYVDEAKWNNELQPYFDQKNFGTGGPKPDWHPAIAGVTVSNELDMQGACKNRPGEIRYPVALNLAAAFLKVAAQKGFSTSVFVGLPISFGEGTIIKTPGWDRFNEMINHPGLAPYKAQLMLNPNTYNDRNFLFGQNGQDGWVQATYAKFQVPILFTEIGKSRVPDGDAASSAVVKGQLQGTLDYQRAHPGQVLGAIHFMFDNKIWKQTSPETDSEGAFGSFRHGATVKTMTTVNADYDFWAADNKGDFAIDKLEPTATFDAVTSIYLDPSY